MAGLRPDVAHQSPRTDQPGTGSLFPRGGGDLHDADGRRLAGGKAAAGIVVLLGSVRFLVSGLYELNSAVGLEHAAGIIGLAFVTRRRVCRIRQH